ncbi:MAG: hypothetical protein HY736_07695 [Verrucomicrobia bacterium]|nr:hypothetical protein [Verrucomicrobiota bacterium]
MTKSMHTALHDLKLERLFVVHPGRNSYVMNDQTEAVAEQSQAGFCFQFTKDRLPLALEQTALGDR